MRNYDSDQKEQGSKNDQQFFMEFRFGQLKDKYSSINCYRDRKFSHRSTMNGIAIEEDDEVKNDRQDSVKKKKRSCFKRYSFFIKNKNNMARRIRLYPNPIIAMYILLISIHIEFKLKI